MALIVILLCLGLQRYLKVSVGQFRMNWVAPYYHWLLARMSSFVKGQTYLELLLLVLPFVLIIGLVFAISYHVFGTIGYLVLSALLLWYCVDAVHPVGSASITDLIEYVYHRLFAMILWYYVFGVVGLALYFTVFEAWKYFQAQAPDNPLTLLLAKVLGLLDWVPIRLLGLTLGLVGHFGSTFKLWKAQLTTGWQAGEAALVKLCFAALQVEPGKESAVSVEEVSALLDRALLVWLVALGLISVAFWLD